MRCWEIKRCGREVGGARVDEYGVCPVSRMMSDHNGDVEEADVVLCWRETNTLCGVVYGGAGAVKMMHCSDCEYYKQAMSMLCGSCDRK